MHDLSFVIITGLSGAGKSLAMRSLEDLGYFCIDNLPPSLIPKLAELFQQASGRIRRVGLVVDIRGGEFFDHVIGALDELEGLGVPYQILYLEASDDTLVRRYKETRRRHPLAPEGRILEGVKEERRRLEPLRGKAHRILDTTDTSPRELQAEVREIFQSDGEPPRMVVNLLTFGFKHGLPIDADLVLDVRFLPNPHYVGPLREHTGLEPAVRDYVLRWSVTRQFLDRLTDFLDFLIPHYVNEGKSQLTIAIGCTGGRHRSVVVAEYLAEHLRGRHQRVAVQHRDMTLPAGGEG